MKDAETVRPQRPLTAQKRAKPFARFPNSSVPAVLLDNLAHEFDPL